MLEANSRQSLDKKKQEQYKADLDSMLLEKLNNKEQERMGLTKGEISMNRRRLEHMLSLHTQAT